MTMNISQGYLKHVPVQHQNHPISLDLGGTSTSAIHANCMGDIYSYPCIQENTQETQTSPCVISSAMSTASQNCFNLRCVNSYGYGNPSFQPTPCNQAPCFMRSHAIPPSLQLHAENLRSCCTPGKISRSIRTAPVLTVPSSTAGALKPVLQAKKICSVGKIPSVVNTFVYSPENRIKEKVDFRTGVEDLRSGNCNYTGYKHNGGSNLYTS